MKARERVTRAASLRGLRWTARLSALERQALALGAGVAGGLGAATLDGPVGPETPWLAGWFVYCCVYLGIVWRAAANLDAGETRRRARWIDPGANTIFVLGVAAAVASSVAVALAVDTGRSLAGPERWGHLALAMASLMASWLLLQTVFALHYARLYYRPSEAGEEPARGLAFPGHEAPDYLDFLYFSCVIGMTAQVADVALQSRPMRRVALWQGLISFAFNLVVLALAINVFAGILGSGPGG